MHLISSAALPRTTYVFVCSALVQFVCSALVQFGHIFKGRGTEGVQWGSVARTVFGKIMFHSLRDCSKK